MSILKRLVSVLLSGVITFIVLAVISKLIMKDENWLYSSANWCICWAIGSFIAKSVKENISGIKATIIYNVILIFCVFFISAFVIGILLNIPTWLKLVGDITIPIGLSSLTNSKWKNT